MSIFKIIAVSSIVLGSLNINAADAEVDSAASGRAIADRPVVGRFLTSANLETVAYLDAPHLVYGLPLPKCAFDSMDALKIAISREYHISGYKAVDPDHIGDMSASVVQPYKSDADRQRDVYYYGDECDTKLQKSTAQSYGSFDKILFGPNESGDNRLYLNTEKPLDLKKDVYCSHRGSLVITVAVAREALGY